MADDDVVDLPRLRLAFDRASYARLRRLLDRLNATGRTLPTEGRPSRSPFLEAVDQAGDAAVQPG